MLFYHYNQSFTLESGAVLKEVHIAYHAWGTLNEERDNVIWVCHALTANSNAKDWWPGLIGEGAAFDTATYFVVCANILGSCYGTTGPTSTNPETTTPYYQSFPLFTIRDMVGVHELLRGHLGINKIYLLAGGSMGGYQALEWCIMRPGLISHLFLITTSAKESAWRIAIHTAQRMAIELDPTWAYPQAGKGSEGLKIARAIGILTYRTYESFVLSQSDTDPDKTNHFKASSYILHQGDKLMKRFSPYCYWALTKAMDTHNLARTRTTLEAVLQSITARTLVIGIESDLLCPLPEQKFLADHIPAAKFVAMSSGYGHDGFLIETAKITEQLSTWLTPS